MVTVDLTKGREAKEDKKGRKEGEVMLVIGVYRSRAGREVTKIGSYVPTLLPYVVQVGG